MHLDESSPLPFYQQLFDQIHERIESGDYPTGSKLPSIRGLAADLGCARNTVETAYHLLTQEGYVESHPGSGYIVQNVSYLQPDAKQMAQEPAGQGDARPRYNFTHGNLEPRTFPAAAWRSLTDDILLSIDNVGCDAYNHPFGEEKLCEAIAWRLNTQRGIQCTADQIIVQGGTQTSIQNLLTLFDNTRDIVAMEEPGYDGVRAVFERSHFPIVPCRVLDGVQTFLSDIEQSGARLLYLTPSSQFPTCQVLPVEARERVLAWAERNDAYILEDDYCRDFRYRERSLPPLASMDTHGRVVYMGTFSKSLSPALRINYLELPEPLLERWKNHFANSYSPVPWLNQQVLARFMADGSWDRHVRRVQAKNRRKYETLTRVLRETMGNEVDILENGTGLHLLVRVRDGRSQSELIEAARAEDVQVYGTQKYWANPAHTPDSTVLVGFSAIAEEDIEPGIRALAKAWFG
ncbi:PLP-dependent aminotransferase family protein [uncultured Adlercreutzia sp.]|uniref:MocR-like pyridoxine biosynthesis transcription factor PdxR n=1 Tax=uncultured Adlercreutzia sp. TaxID=875803 RepID=UPI0025CE0C16|nr:PLP-dependent aminotransferase family protein [uncultured Adlercreutzia sp.]